MKTLLITFLSLSLTFLAGCEPSGIAKQEMEKFSGTPTPTFAPIPTEVPIDPADVVQVDTNLGGDTLSANGPQEKKLVTCTKYNNVTINGDQNTVTIRGVCRRVMINGDGSKIMADAAAEFVFNGTANTLTYSRFANGKRPSVVESIPGNTINWYKAPSKEELKREAKY
jgi:hypothetical protein